MLYPGKFLRWRPKIWCIHRRLPWTNQKNRRNGKYQTNRSYDNRPSYRWWKFYPHRLFQMPWTLLYGQRDLRKWLWASLNGNVRWLSAGYCRRLYYSPAGLCFIRSPTCQSLVSKYQVFCQKAVKIAEYSPIKRVNFSPYKFDNIAKEASALNCSIYALSMQLFRNRNSKEIESN